MRFIIIFLGWLSSSLMAQASLDMVGRSVEIPKRVQRVFPASPPMMILLYALAPETMIGVNYVFREEEKRYMLPYVRDLPPLGSFFGSGNEANVEKVLTLKPDIVFGWDVVRVRATSFEHTLERFRIPLVYLAQSSIGQTKDALLVMGKFLGKEERAQTLVSYAENNLQRVKKSVDALGERKKAKVYLAQGEDGLTTECDGNMQSEIIPLAGGVNVHTCGEKLSGGSQKETISIEKLYMYDPDVIFVWDKRFYEALKHEKKWHHLRAYKENKIYFAPITPFSWLSRPPSLMRFLGVVWMHHRLYPDHFTINEVEEVRNFYTLFLHVTLDEKDVQNILKGE